MENLGLISRGNPVLVESKKSRYVINDPFFEFWFRFVNPNKAALELGLDEKVWSNIAEDFNAYLRKVFEKVSKEYVVSEIRLGKIGIDADVVGRWQHGEEEIDLIAYSSREKRGVFFEAKWKDLSYEEAKSIILRLVEKSSPVKMREKKYGIIAKKISGKKRLGAEGYFALDLEDMSP